MQDIENNVQGVESVGIYCMNTTDKDEQVKEGEFMKTEDEDELSGKESFVYKAIMMHKEEEIW